MSYASYSQGAPFPALRPSPSESEASGLRIGRLDVWPEGVVSGRTAAHWIENSDFDLVIVRLPSPDRTFARELRRSSLDSWQADTLLYFTLDTLTVAKGDEGLVLSRLDDAERLRSDDVVSRVFDGYSNHYRSSSLFDRMDVVRGYQDWTRAAAGRADHSVFICKDDFGTTLGIAVVDQTAPAVSEVLLAGVVPEGRGRGMYTKMLRLVVAEEVRRGASRLVISTQAANTGVMRAWCRLGFLPALSLDTLHVTRSHLERTSPRSSQLP